MSRKVLGTVVAVQFVVICVLGFLLLRMGRPTAECERVEAALTDLHGALSVGANFTQLQERVQVLAAAVDAFQGKGGGNELPRFEQSLRIYKDSVDLWNDELSDSREYENRMVGDTFVDAPTTLGRIAKEQGFDISAIQAHYAGLPAASRVPYKIVADVVLRQLWAKADEAGRGVKTEKEPPK